MRMKTKTELWELNGRVGQRILGIVGMFKHDFNNYVAVRTEPKIGKNKRISPVLVAQVLNIKNVV